MADLVHLMKLSVGTADVADLARWQEQRAATQSDRRPRHVTRMWPRREAELLAGGSIYWVIGGLILCRQQLLDLEERRGEDGTLRCGLVLDPKLVRTAAVPRRPFQGWRYLQPADAPPDLPEGRDAETALPPGLSAALAEIGVL